MTGALMRLDTDQELSNNLDDAELLGICLFVASNRECGVLRRRLKSGELVSPRQGMYLRSSFWNGLSPAEKTARIIRTLGIAHPSWTFSHASAALIHGIDVSYELLSPIHVITPDSEGGKNPRGIKRHRPKAFQGTLLGSTRVTTIDQTVIDCAMTYNLSFFLPIGDYALRHGLTTRARLDEELRGRIGHRGVLNARKFVSLIDTRAESGGESFVRGRLIELGIPFVDLQGCVRNPEQPWRPYRMDIVLQRPDGFYVDLEVDGTQKYEDPEMTKGKTTTQVAMDERQREAFITSYGIRVARITPKQARNAGLLTRRLAHYGIFPTNDARTRPS